MTGIGKFASLDVVRHVVMRVGIIYGAGLEEFVGQGMHGEKTR